MHIYGVTPKVDKETSREKVETCGPTQSTRRARSLRNRLRFPSGV